ncbi:competence protein ComEC (plasmid) [Chromobacterium amazonense]|uniref:ComEC/Rec2 family competence protein n=1 Tax=Chromobacterium amazonense TaxID=1382803 RepID=UPI00237D4F51|nr:competence protein ComEC [Chromobacterium amazonense]MDE1714375.1 competence protein ComEC [Chromobacterium amazonense]
MAFEIDFLPVGDTYGDAIVIRYGDDANGYFLHVVDGGRVDTGQTIIDHINKYYPGYYINHMVVSHADNDHACGLIDVLKQFEVKNLWMNRPWLYASETLQHFHGNFTLQGLIDDMKERHPYLVELEALATEKGTQIHEVFQGMNIGQFRVLAPSRERYIELIPDFEKTPTSYKEEAKEPTYGLLRSFVEAAKKWLEEKWDVETLSENPQPPTSASNESCVVQYATLDGNKTILLTADVGPVGLNEAADYAAVLGLTYPNFVQVPHHGSRHNVTPATLDRWLGPKKPQGTVVGTAFCSIGANKPEYPRGQVKNAFIRRGYEVYANRTIMISHYSGPGHTGLVPLTPEAFDTKVEA